MSNNPQNSAAEPKYHLYQNVIYVGKATPNIIKVGHPYTILSIQWVCCCWRYYLGVNWPPSAKIERAACSMHPKVDITQYVKSEIYFLEGDLAPIEEDRNEFAESICTKIEESFKIKPITISPIYLLPKELQPCPQ